jgi:hypothetical protein
MEDMETAVAGLYGLTGTFFTTDVRYIPPFPDDNDFAPPMPVSDSDDDMDDAMEGDDDPSKTTEEKAAESAEREARRQQLKKSRREILRKARDKLMMKLREMAYEGR